MPRPKLRKILLVTLKLVIAGALLWWALRIVDWPQFLRTLRGLSVGWAVAGGLAFMASVVVIAYRWWGLVQVQQIPLGLWESVRLTFLGSFFNYIVLGTTGGDLVKAWYLSKHGSARTTALVTVVVDRLLGLTGMTLLSAVMLIAVFSARAWFGATDEHRPQLLAAAAICGVVLGALLAGCTFLLSRRVRRWLRLERLYDRLPLARQIASAREALRRYREHLGQIRHAMLVTGLAQLCFLGGIAMMGVSLHLAVPWYQYFIYLPLVYIIAAVPIVPGGVGLAEVSYVAFFEPWAGREEILALALLARIIPMFCTLPGLWVAMTGPRIPSAQAMEAELAEGSSEASPAGESV